jgi:hypothetical protein
MNMEVLMSLLNAKNRCLERFLAISKEFGEKAAESAVEGLEQFQVRRDATLKAIELFDRKISEAARDISSSERTPRLIDAVQAALDRKNELVQQILKADENVIQKIEQSKLDLLKELASSRKSKEVLSKFKSSWVAESGEELDKTL